MRASVEHYHVLHEHVVILSIDIQPVPRVLPTDRLVIDDLGYTDDGITHVSGLFGYMDAPNVPEVLRLLETAETECPVEVDTASYFVSALELRRGVARTMAQWHKRLFLATYASTLWVTLTPTPRVRAIFRFPIPSAASSRIRCSTAGFWPAL